MSRFRAQLPAPFPGCWKDPEFRRVYNCAWMRCQRADPQAYRDTLARQRAWRAVDRDPKEAHACYGCGRPAGPSYIARRVRMDGHWVWALVRWCGNC